MMSSGAELKTPPTQTGAPARAGGSSSPIRHLRWYICGLLFLITTINYLDRQSLAIMRETIIADLHWSEAAYGWINFSFQTAYAIFMTVAGRIIDLLGVKLALGLAIGLWSLAVAGHAFARNTIHFCIARFCLGAAESANFPASIKAVAQWFPQRERALATGVFNSGSNVGIMLAPLALVIATYGLGIFQPSTHQNPVTVSTVAIVSTQTIQGGAVQVTIDPREVTVADKAGDLQQKPMRWRRIETKPGQKPLVGPWFNSGATESGVAPGNYKIEFEAVHGWRKTANQEVSVAANQTTQISTTYRPMSWRFPFVVIGILGILVLFCWWKTFYPPESHPKLTVQELQEIKAGQPPAEQTAKIHWTALLRCKQVWPFLVGKFMTDPVWWFYLYWLPPYLAKERGMAKATDFWVLVVPYLSADVGSIFGGWFSSHLIGKGWRIGSARYMAMLICALCMPGAIYAVYTSHFWTAIILISFATAGHQGWSANIFTTATDMFPSRYAGSVVGLGGSTGALGGMFMTLLVGMTLQWFPNDGLGYKMVFTWAGLMHLSSLVIFLAIAGLTMKQVDLEKTIDMSRPHRGLIAGGTLSVLVGLVLSGLICIKWDVLVAAMKGYTGPAGGLTAAIGVALIGLVLLYAALPRKNADIA